MRAFDFEQGSPEWHAYRCGRATASRIADIIARTKSGYSASRANYAAQLIAERLTGAVAESYTNDAMRWGAETEPQARAAYEIMTNASVVRIGLVQHPTIEMSCASPDGLVMGDGLIEIKCPNTATHIDTLLTKTIPGKYVTQMQWQMACTGRAWCDYVSFDPRMPGEMRLFIKRVEADPAVHDVLTGEVVTFLGEVSDTVSKLTDEYGLRDAA